MLSLTRTKGYNMVVNNTLYRRMSKLIVVEDLIPKVSTYKELTNYLNRTFDSNTDVATISAIVYAIKGVEDAIEG